MRPVQVAADRRLHEQGLHGPFNVYVTYGPPSAPNLDPAHPYLYVASPDWHAVYSFEPGDIDASTYGFDPPEEGYELTLPLYDFRPLWDDWSRLSRRKRVALAKQQWSENERTDSTRNAVDEALCDTLRRQGWSIVWDSDGRSVTDGERQLLVGAVSQAVWSK